MPNPFDAKREVWEHAKQTGLDDFIQAVSRVFPDAIDQVTVVSPGKKTKYDRGANGRIPGKRTD